MAEAKARLMQAKPQSVNQARLPENEAQVTRVGGFGHPE
jgi:hypothetical protein